MDLVIDANVVFAVLIKDGESARLFMHEKIHLYAPQYLFEEIEKYSDLLLEKTHRSRDGFREILSILNKRIKFVPESV